MHKLLRFMAVLVFTSSCLAQAKPGNIAASAAWEPPGDLRDRVSKACGASSPQRQYADCVMSQMSKAGASAGAVNFTRELYQQSHGEVGIMTAFHHVGAVDVAWVLYPLHEPSDHGIFLVNGEPRLLNTDDLKQLDQRGMRLDPLFQNLQSLYPKVGVWPSNPQNVFWPNTQHSPDGGLQFIMGYPLRNGCSTCSVIGVVLFTWNFATDGRFTGASFYRLMPARRPTEP